MHCGCDNSAPAGGPREEKGCAVGVGDYCWGAGGEGAFVRADEVCFRGDVAEGVGGVGD